MSFNSLLPVFRSRKSETDVFRDLQTEVSRVFDQFNAFTSMSANLDLSAADEYTTKPNIDVTETDSAMEITVDVPGVDEADLDVQLDGRLLTIKGSRATEKTEENKDYKIVERSSGSFQRAIRLPFEPESDKIAAKLDVGVLTLTVDKPAVIAQKVKKISIGSAVSDSGKKKVEGKAKREDSAPA